MNSIPHVFSRYNRPVVLGHRGVAEQHQENTLAGFQKAMELGIDGVELDVILSKDQKLVVFHDDDLHRLTGQHGAIENMDWQTLKQLKTKHDVDVGSRIIQYAEEQPLCLLEQVLEEVRGKLLVNIELKGMHPDTGKLAANLIQSMDLANQVFVTSFHTQPLLSFYKTTQQAATPVAAGFAFSIETQWWEWLKQRFNRSAIGSKRVGARLSSMNIDMLDHQVIQQHHRCGCAIGGWTFLAQQTKYFKGFATHEEELERIRSLQQSGLDFFITDDPVQLQQLVENSSAAQ